MTNYHVLAGVLSGAAGKVLPGAMVAKVLLLNGEGVQQAFDGYLVGECFQSDFLSFVIVFEIEQEQLCQDWRQPC